ncbi:uncharacterized protein FIESC28_03691 [Fusarium coffeatum]|uniref:Mid2 domain-containing protein n=1 Tax=Fusarium coffeatum TaxID=231269 RepID=A0A366S2F5_9HYPO|nr:uncharacterized protein FIESC28_03691 [Fusarium coffeatum]RBR23509.1 hypothetical protein FIESC28_03691 [Fusarium coffeatum]
MMAESVQTRPGNPSRLEQAFPMVTELASLDERDVIHGRQVYQDCGFFQYNDNTSEWQTWLCVDTSSSTTTTCKTINENFGCFVWMPTTCYASTESARCNNLDKKQLCCTDPTFSECMIAQKTVGTQKLTAYVCANNPMEVSIYESTYFPTSTSEEETSSTGTESSGTPETSISRQIIDVDSTIASTTGEQTSNSNDSSSDNESRSSSTPIGPIVGGVIGGLALIALVGLGIWLIRRKKQHPGAVPSQGGYHPQSQSLPHYDYVNPAYAAPQYNQPPMSSTQANESQRFSNLPYAASPQASELPSPPARPKTPEF